MLVIDDSTRKWSGNKRWNLGWVPAILVFIIIAWNFFVLLGMLIYHLYLCWTTKKTTTCCKPTGQITIDKDQEIAQVNYVTNTDG